MNNEKLQIVLGEDQHEVIIREGKAPDMLPKLAPIKTDITGTIGCVTEYLQKRIDCGQFDQENCHIIVDRDDVSIELVINESNAYTVGHVKGKLTYHPAFLAFGINSNKTWTPQNLGMFFKMNRAFFTNKDDNRKLVSTLLHFQADIQQRVDRDSKENGGRTDNFTQTVNSNLPEAFKLHIPIFKGNPAEDIEVETFAQINGRDVEFVLLSPGARETLETIRDTQIDSQLESIRATAPDIAIIEV